jgi:hypothetical protein
MSVGTRRTIGLAVFAIGTAVCGVWGYVWTSPALSPFMMLEEREPFEFVHASLIPLVLAFAPAFTFWLTRRAMPSLSAKALRIGHLAAIVLFIATGRAILATASSVVPTRSLASFITVTLYSFMPVQAFWVNGALALWIASPRSPIVQKRDRDESGTAA